MALRNQIILRIASKKRLEHITLVMKTYDRTDMKISNSDEIHAANLACALRWHDLGLPVFWCREDKHPVSKWGAENSRAPTMAPSWLTDTHAAWRQHRVPESASERLPAIVVADRIIVDLDRHPGKADGVAAFLALTADEPARESWVVSKTASSGLHLHFAPHPEIVGNSKKGLPDGIDIRAAGKGYAIACGTMRADGRRYEPLAGDPCVAGATLPPMPESLLALIRAARESIGAMVVRGEGYVAGQRGGDDEAAYLAAAIAEAQKEFRSPGGQTNHFLNERCYGIFNYVFSGYGDPTETANKLFIAATSHWRPSPEQEQAIMATIMSAAQGSYRHGRRHALLPVPPRYADGNAIPPHLR